MPDVGTGPGRPRTARVLAAACALLTLVATALLVVARPPVTPDLLFLVVDVTVALVYGTVAAVVLSRRSHPVPWLVALAGLGGGVSAVAGGWVTLATARGTAVPEVAYLLLGAAWVPGTLALFLVVPWLVRETPLTPGARAGAVLGALVVLAFTGQRTASPWSDPTAAVWAVVAVGLLAAAAVGLRRRRGPVAERRGLGLLAAGTALMALSFAPLALVPFTDDGVVLLVPLSHLACQALYPAALLVTMLRNRLWGIDLAVSRAVLAGMLTLGLVAVYAGCVWLATAVVGSSTAAQVVAAVGVVLAVQPVRRRLDTGVRRLVWGEATSPGRAALHVGASLSAANGADDLLARLAGGVGEALRLESVTLTLPDGTTGRWGVPTGDPTLRAVPGAGGALATVAVTPRPGERLDTRTLDALDHLAPVVAVGLGLVEATRETLRARDAATRARLAERRVIRRELHDGIGPWLSGLRLGLQGARNVLATDPGAADAVLAALQEETRRRVEDVRSLSRSLLPPVLDTAGLPTALGELAATHAAAGFTVAVTGPPEGDAALRVLDPRVAAAAYAVAAEAVTNAVRHSGASCCDLRVSLEDDVLVVEVVDAGAGRAADARDGVGTRSMHERTAELGGVLEVGPGADGAGTRVAARLPLVPTGVPA